MVEHALSGVEFIYNLPTVGVLTAVLDMACDELDHCLELATSQKLHHASLEPGIVVLITGLQRLILQQLQVCLLTVLLEQFGDCFEGTP